MQHVTHLNRRHFLTLLAAGSGLTLTPSWLQSATGDEQFKSTIPSTDEKIPAIGMGTWITFNVGNDPEARDARTEVLRAFFSHGGGMIDSSPMYGSAEAVLGYGLEKLSYPNGLFAATKIWTSSQTNGKHQVAEAQRLWGIERFDLWQVHNLLSWRAHLDTLQAMKADGKVRYIGITTSHGRRHSELADIMSTQPIDFIQLTYNIVDREAEQRLLPLAKEKGIAVIANRPFQGGYLIDRMQRHPLPSWAAEIDCTNWAQFLLKFIIAHPAITCAIPATSQVVHMHENMGAMQGRLPDAAMRQRMSDYVKLL